MNRSKSWRENQKRSWRKQESAEGILGIDNEDRSGTSGPGSSVDRAAGF